MSQLSRYVFKQLFSVSGIYWHIALGTPQIVGMSALIPDYGGPGATKQSSEGICFPFVYLSAGMHGLHLSCCPAASVSSTVDPHHALLPGSEIWRPSGSSPKLTDLPSGR